MVPMQFRFALKNLSFSYTKSFYLAVAMAFFCVFHIGCSQENVTITAEYIINEKWNERGEQVGSNSIRISKMRVKKDSILNPVPSPPQADILGKLEIDSSFIYYANVKIPEGESYNGKKIYFNKDNGFTWRNHVTGMETKFLDDLQPGNWYEFSGLRHSPSYIYVDSVNKVYRFDVNTANY
jgi:hypothetical protein